MDKKIGELNNQISSLEAEADWLAGYLCDIACTRDVKPCTHEKSCRECWREAARKATSCPNIDTCNRKNFSATECCKE